MIDIKIPTMEPKNIIINRRLLPWILIKPIIAKYNPIKLQIITNA